MSTVKSESVATATPGPAIDPRLDAPPQKLSDYAFILKRRIRSGELGALPVVLGLALIWIIFQSLNSRFLSAQNLSNLTLQIAATGTIAVGIVLVLLLGEIDLSVGSVSGVTAAVMAVLAVRHGVSDVLAIAAAIAVGVAIGALHGTIFVKLGVPSFVVTLAGLIGWQGLQLYVLGERGTINIPFDGTIARLTSTTLAAPAGWAVGAVAVAAYVITAYLGRRRRMAAGLPVAHIRDLIIRTVALGVGIGISVAILNSWRGVPLALLIMVGFVVFFDLILRKTQYGRSIFAVGGNIEAARRAGIRVDWIRISVFMIASGMAAVGGILAASRGYAVTQASGAGDTLLMAIAAAVIGGTSLFGGRGSTYSALLGMLVLGSVQSGMLLLQLDSSVRFMITAAVLLAAVILDAVSRRGRRSTGRG